jgi:hypothetical protein
MVNRTMGASHRLAGSRFFQTNSESMMTLEQMRRSNTRAYFLLGFACGLMSSALLLIIAI